MNEVYAMLDEFAKALLAVSMVPEQLVEQFTEWGAALETASDKLGLLTAPLATLGELALSGKPLVAGFQALGAAVLFVTPSMNNLSAMLNGLVVPAIRVFATTLTGTVGLALQGLALTAGQSVVALGALAVGATTLIGSIATASANLAAMAAGGGSGGMAAGIGGFAKGLTGLINPFTSLAGVVGPFVQALNPGLMQLFNQALRDVTATFGVAFAPIISHLAALFNELSATLLPAMQALAPIFDNLMSVMESYLIPAVGMAVDAFLALAPILEFASSVLASWAEMARVMMTVWRSVFQTFIDYLRSLFGGTDLKDASKSIQDVLRQLASQFVQFAAYLAKSIGQLGFIDHLIKNLRDMEGKRPGIQAAPQNQQTSGLEQISKSIALAAAFAQGAGGARKKSEAESLEELIKQLEDVKNNGKSLQNFLDAMWPKIVQGIKENGLAMLETLLNWLGINLPLAANETKRQDLVRQLEDKKRQRGEAGRVESKDFWEILWDDFKRSF